MSIREELLDLVRNLPWLYLSALVPLTLFYFIYRLALKHRNSNSFRFIDSIPGLILVGAQKLRARFKGDIAREDYLVDEYKGLFWRPKFRMTKKAIARFEGLS